MIIFFSPSGEFTEKDTTLSVTKGPIPKCGSVYIPGDVAKRCSEFTGHFFETEHMLNGKYVFENFHGKCLFSSFVLDYKEITESKTCRWIVANNINEPESYKIRKGFFYLVLFSLEYF